MANELILCVDDEAHILELLTFNLEASGYRVVTAENGEDALVVCARERPAMILLDIMLPGKDGWEVCREIRKSSNVPIIMLSAKGETFDKVLGLELGADDYLNKPFDSEVLLYKIKAITERGGAETAEAEENAQTEFKIGSFTFDSKLRNLSNGTEEYKLSPKENALLKLLCQHMGDLMPRELALVRIWKDDNYFTARSMDVYIVKLRKYLKSDPKVSISNIHGEGFRLVVEP